jgi:hypothetical protein
MNTNHTPTPFEALNDQKNRILDCLLDITNQRDAIELQRDELVATLLDILAYEMSPRDSVARRTAFNRGRAVLKKVTT